MNNYNGDDLYHTSPAVIAQEHSKRSIHVYAFCHLTRRSIQPIAL